MSDGGERLLQNTEGDAFSLRRSGSLRPRVESRGRCRSPAPTPVRPVAGIGSWFGPVTSQPPTMRPKVVPCVGTEACDIRLVDGDVAAAGRSTYATRVQSRQRWHLARGPLGSLVAFVASGDSRSCGLLVAQSRCRRPGPPEIGPENPFSPSPSEDECRYTGRPSCC